jgi:uncharacterized repeat protein (TIGR01451 family)
LARLTLARVAFAALILSEGALLADWQQTSFLRESRSGHTATLLFSGKVLVTGGVNGPSHLSRIGSTELYDPATGTWTLTGSLQIPRYQHTATLLPSGKVLVVGGTADHSLLASAELYDPASGVWSLTGSLITPRYGHTATLLPTGKVLVVGGAGEASGSLASAELYDPAAGTWSPTGSTQQPHTGHTATLLQSGKVLLAGGWPVSAEVYDPASGTWEPTGSLSTQRSGHTATLLPSGEVLIVGGFSNSVVTASTDIYDPEEGTWRFAAFLGQGREDHSATLLPSGRVLVVGGTSNGGFGDSTLSGAEVFDPGRDLWEDAGSLDLRSQRHTATVLPSGGVLVAGGEYFNQLSLAEIYYPPTGICQATASLAVARLNPEVVLLPSGKVLVTGGTAPSAELYDELVGDWEPTGFPVVQRWRASTFLLASGKVLMAGGYGPSLPGLEDRQKTAELYDPVTGTWEATGALLTGRSHAAGSLLPSGMVLVAGGLRGEIGALASAELYDPATGTWSSTGSLATPRYDHTSTLLPSGKVLVVGGADDSSPLVSAEIYDPSTGTWEPTGDLFRARSGHTATLLPSGKVLVVGGDEPAAPSAELYDPATGTWTTTGFPAFPRRSHTATLLPSGRVFVASGTSSEIYDPATGLWEAPQPLADLRNDHGAIFLPTTKTVLLVGGRDSQGTYKKSAEECWFAPTPVERWPNLWGTPPLEYGVPFSVTGTGLRGDSEASGGNTQSSAANVPLLLLRSLDGSRQTWLTPDPRPNFWDDPMTLTVSDLPPVLHPGPHLLSVTVAGVPSPFVPVDVICSLAITRHPSSQITALGSTVTFQVESQGGRRYQWRRDGVDIPGATAPSYTTPPISPDDSGAVYIVEVGTGCMNRVSDAAVLTITDSTAPSAAVISPSGGEYWLVSQSGATNKEVVTWSMSDDIRICRVEVRLLFSSDGGQTYIPVPDPPGGLLLSAGPGGTCRFGEQPTVTNLSYSVPAVPPSGVSGSLYKIEVRLTDHAGLVTTARSPNPFFIVQPNPDSIRTLILSNVSRMSAVQGISQEMEDALAAKLRELAGHPRVQGLVVDLAGVTSLTGLYQAWDAAPANPDRANAVLFAPGGLHDYLRSELLPTYTGIRNVVLVGDDRIIPFARVPDQTGLRESAYIAEGDLTAAGTVGAALAADRYLSDDLLATRGPVDIPLTADQQERGAFLPDFAVGRLVERPEEIVTAIATFINQDGVLDLQALHPSTGHKVLVTGYDFLIDSGRRIRRRWKEALDLPLPHHDGDLEPVDGRLLTTDWGEASVAGRHNVLRQHLAGNGGDRYGIANLNGHANHHQEGVPGAGMTDIQGLGATEIFGPGVCGGGSALTLGGAVIYSSGCHGGLPVAGSCSTDADHSLDLPQTFLARGAQAYVGNTGYGWGLKEGVGYGERLVEIFTEELTAGGTVAVGDAVLRAKQRYFLELPRFDDYDEKTLLQWTLFGLPMYAIRTGIVSTPGASLESRRDTPLTGQVGPVRVKSRIEAAVSLPPHLTQLNAHFDFSAPGVYTKYNALGDPLPEGTVGCPAPSPGSPSGCYYTLNSLAGGGTGSSDLPIQPYFLYDSRLSGTSQHGVLWMGGTYAEESGWEPVIAELVSNGGDFSNHGSTPWLIRHRPRPVHRPTGDDELTCRPSDLEPSTLVVVTGESLKVGDSDPGYSRERVYRGVDLEVLYFNDQGQGGNCDRSGPELGSPTFGGAYHRLSGGKIDWVVPASDEAGVWRVVVVYDPGPEGDGQGAWRPVELTADGSGTWRGSLATAGISRLTYVLQAVDRHGNVSWLDFDTVDLPVSGVPHDLPLPVEVIVPRGTADLSLQLSDSPDPVTAGGLLTYTVSVANAGPGEAISLKVTDTLPVGTTYLAAGGLWACGHDQGTVTCTLPSLPAISSTTLTLFVSAPKVGGSTLNQAVVSAVEEDTDLSNNSRTEQTFVNGPPPSPGLSFYTVTPCRVADTRQTSDPFRSGTTRTFPVAGVCGIPPSAQAVSLNATAVGGTTGGHITLFPAGQSLPSTITINFQAGQTRANNAVLGLSSNGHLAVLAALTGGSVHLVLDVNGYFAEEQP